MKFIEILKNSETMTLTFEDKQKLYLKFKDSTVYLSKPLFSSQIGQFDLTNSNLILKGNEHDYELKTSTCTILKVQNGICDRKVYVINKRIITLLNEVYTFYDNKYIGVVEGKIVLDKDSRDFYVDGYLQKENFIFKGHVYCHIDYDFRAFSSNYQYKFKFKLDEKKLYSVYDINNNFVSFYKNDIIKVDRNCDKYFYTDDYTFFCVKHLRDSMYKVYVNTEDWTMLDTNTCKAECKIDDDSQVILYIITYYLLHNKDFFSKHITIDDIQQVKSILDTDCKSYKILKSKYYNFIQSICNTQPNAPPMEGETEK